jgi:hypothetical protein
VKDKLRILLASVDFWIALAISGGLFIATSTVTNSLAKDLYAMGVTVISVVFALFLAAMAIITASGSDDFVEFLEEEGHFTLVIWGFKVTLFLLFLTLLASIGLYAFTSFWIAQQYETQNHIWLSMLTFFVTWSLIATYQSAADSLTYSRLRTAYIAAKRGHTPAFEGTTKALVPASSEAARSVKKAKAASASRSRKT